MVLPLRPVELQRQPKVPGELPQTSVTAPTSSPGCPGRLVGAAQSRGLRQIAWRGPRHSRGRPGNAAHLGASDMVALLLAKRP